MDPVRRHRFAESWHPPCLPSPLLAPSASSSTFEGINLLRALLFSLLPPSPSPPPSTTSSTICLLVPPRPVVVTRRCSSSTSRSSSPFCSLSPSSAPRPRPQSGPQRLTPPHRNVHPHHGLRHRSGLPLPNLRHLNVLRPPSLLPRSVHPRQCHPWPREHLNPSRNQILNPHRPSSRARSSTTRLTHLLPNSSVSSTSCSPTSKRLSGLESIASVWLTAILLNGASLFDHDHVLNLLRE